MAGESNRNLKLSDTLDFLEHFNLSLFGWSKKRLIDGTHDGTPEGRYATDHCPVVVYVRRTHDGTLARGVVQATGQRLRHV